MQKVILLTGLLLLSFFSSAQTTEAGLGVSSLGAHIVFTNQMNDQFGLRLQLNGYSGSYEFKENGLTYEGDLKLGTVGVTMDWHPWENDFFVAMGAFYNGNQLDARAKSQNGVITINGTAYTTDQIGNLESEMKFGDVSPYLGAGFMGKIGQSDFYYGVDLGVLYQGEPDISLKTSSGSSITGLSENLAAEQKRVEDELSSFRWYPVLTLSLHYSF
ncbi:hypothetical protein [Endozoicomonas numazuensis]|uniref:Outer membrane protein beta-barrel domain-containing protein n=1 Tax=Endozoicomonas numazuensis TaxID=1137799 RepID=A0A081NI49_9GAMM|nr:hypothetical protein [Endozoicomonas numazuensis]KEQ18122.1 hypothetical protein GZ78_11185 [Endozoicomonas numazuensis]